MLIFLLGHKSTQLGSSSSFQATSCGLNISHILKTWAGLLSPLLAVTHAGATPSTVQFSKSAIRC